MSSRQELIDILKLRINVFDVEQDCPYLEADNRDQNAIHMFPQDENGIQAYPRVMGRGVEGEHSSIGGVIAVKRRCGLGTRILVEGMLVARKHFGAHSIYLEAQSYSKGLYEKQGFQQVSDEFLLDGIPHVKMFWRDGA